jgi:hypothetical protein
MVWRFSVRWIAAVSILAVMALGLVPSAALAQGLYYKEILKDGRYYVFNVAANAARFEASGETGVGITKPGAGPNGETVVGDNERALQLFFFKHGLSEAVPDPPAPPPPAPPYRFTGLVFGDFYNFNANHVAKFNSQNGFWFRRLYFTYDHTFTPKVSMRWRIEMNSNGTMAGGSLTPYVKDGWVRWNYFGRQMATLGIQPTTTFDFLETFWGLRHIEKTPADLYKLDSSRDFGLTLSGPINEAGTLKYSAQVANDSSSNSEADKNKALRFEARYETNPGFVLQGFYGFFSRPLGADRTTYQGFAGYQHKMGRVGVQYLYQQRKHASNSTAADVKLHVMSGFGVYNIKPQKVSIFGRVDRFQDPTPDGAGIDYLPIDTKEAFTFATGGLEIYIIPNLRVSPNFELVRYSNPATGTKPKDDTVARLTFYWTW